MKESGRTPLSLQEWIILGLVAWAALVVWGVLIAALLGSQDRSPSVQDVARPQVVHVTAQTAPSPTRVPTREARSTPTSLPPTTTLTTTMPTEADHASTIVDTETTVIALLGIDESREASIWRTDSIILVLLNPGSQRIGILSIPRDLWVYIPGFGQGRINTVDTLGEQTDYPDGGLGLLDATLRHNLDIPIDHYARIDFWGFADLIDRVGGITIDVQAPIRDRFPDPLDPSGWTQLTLAAGRQEMDGHTALSYARSRMTTSDFDRSRRQQQVIVALWAKALTFDTLIRIPRLWKELRAIVDTDLTMPEAVRLAYIVYEIGVENARTKRLGAGTTIGWITPSGAQVLLPDKGSIQDTVRDLLSAPE